MPKFHCQACGQRISADDEQIGQQSTCPNCSASITVPESFSPYMSDWKCNWCGQKNDGMSQACTLCSKHREEDPDPRIRLRPHSETKSSVSAGVEEVTIHKTRTQSFFSGYGRILFVLSLIGIVFLAAFAVALTDERIVGTLVLAPLLFVAVCYRLKSAGHNQLWSLLLLVPIVSLVLVVYCGVAQPKEG